MLRYEGDNDNYVTEYNDSAAEVLTIAYGGSIFVANWANNTQSNHRRRIC